MGKVDFRSSDNCINFDGEASLSPRQLERDKDVCRHR